MRRLAVYHGYLKTCVNHRMRVAVGESGLELLWRPSQAPWISFREMQSEFTPVPNGWGSKPRYLSARRLRDLADDGVYSALSKDITGRRPMRHERGWEPFFIERMFPENWDVIRTMKSIYEW